MRSKWVGRSVVVLAIAAVVFGLIAYLGRATPTGHAFGISLSFVPEAVFQRRTIRVGTFNIDGGRGIDGVVNLDRTAKSLQRLDFIGLNEVHATAEGNQASALGRILDLPYLFAPTEQRWGHDAFGNGILTRLKVVKWDRVPLSNEPWHALRNYVVTEAEWDGKPIRFVTTHVDFKAGGEAQKAAVIRTFLDLPTPCVLMGDLNSPPADAAIKQLRATSGVTEAVSAIMEEIPKRVDWIFVRGLKVIDAGQVDTGASDHPAYWAELWRE